MDNNSKYFDDFVWAVPISFSDPLSKCRFEQGDMLYDTKKTYEEPWGEALKIMNYSIQISFPSRAQTAKTNQEAEIVFSSNWDSEVVFDLYNYKVGKKEKITSTQGRLYTLLWKGDLDSILNPGKSCSKPLIVKDAMKKLDLIKTHITKTMQIDYKYIFFFPYDLTNQILRNKIQNVKMKFDQQRTLITYTLNHMTAKDINLPSAELYAPTLKFAIFAITGELELINKCLKDALYTPSKNKKTQKEMFRLKTHGRLIQLN